MPVTEQVAIQADLAGVGLILYPCANRRPDIIEGLDVKLIDPRVFEEANHGAPVYHYRRESYLDRWVLDHVTPAQPPEAA